MKQLAIILMAGVFALGVTACGDQGTKPTTEKTEVQVNTPVEKVPAEKAPEKAPETQTQQ